MYVLIEGIKVLAEVNIPFENNSYIIDLLNLYHDNQLDELVPTE